MANITNYLNKIKTAVYGKDVRGAIHDAIKQVYDDASVNHDNANMEVKMARGTHNTLNDRLDNVDEIQAQTNAQLSNVKTDISAITYDEVYLFNFPKQTGEIDDTERLKRALNSISSGVVIITESLTISDKINFYSNKTIKGRGITQTKVNFRENAGFVMKDSFSEISNLLIKLDENYSGDAITIECQDYGHTWGQVIKNIKFDGSITKKSEVNAIKFNPRGNKIILQPKIHNVIFQGVKNSVLLYDDSSTGMVWALSMRDCFSHYFVNVINFNNRSASECLFDKVDGQAHPTYTEYFIKDIAGNNNRVINSTCTDGGTITISERAKFTIIDNNYNSHEKIDDLGWKTEIRATDRKRDYSTYRFERDSFLGNELNNRWRKSVVGSASAVQGFDTVYNPFDAGVILSTGSEASSSVTLDYGKKCIYNRFLRTLISFQFRVYDTNDCEIYMGLRSAWGEENGVFFVIKNGKLIPTVRDGGPTVEYTLNEIDLTTKPNEVQIITSSSKAKFYLNGNYIGELSHQTIDFEPCFKIKNTTNADKKVRISDLYIRSCSFKLNNN